jgi:hypothetical protein
VECADMLAGRPAAAAAVELRCARERKRERERRACWWSARTCWRERERERERETRLLVECADMLAGRPAAAAAVELRCARERERERESEAGKLLGLMSCAIDALRLGPRSDDDEDDYETQEAAAAAAAAAAAGPKRKRKTVLRELATLVNPASTALLVRTRRKEG